MFHLNSICNSRYIRKAINPWNIEFQKQQEHWNAVETARLEAEAENIKQYAKEQEKRAIERQIKRKEANAALAQVQENLAAELTENQRQKVCSFFFSKISISRTNSNGTYRPER